MSDSAPEIRAGLPILAFATLEAWEHWLENAPADCRGVWLKLAKKVAGVPCVTKARAIDGALCHGWIDGQLGTYDERFWLVRFTPRKPGGRWSEVNRSRAIVLMAEGKVRPAGLAEIDAAKADGRWEAAYAPQSRAEIPSDLQSALDAVPAARDFFATLTGANRYAVIYRVNEAKKPETRAARIGKFVALLARGELLHPPMAKGPKPGR